jgi:multidrug efflux pump subunit AcrB
MIVLSKVRSGIESGIPPYEALVNGSASKVRPILLIIITTVLGMIPLVKDPFFSSMAVSLMFGLCFAAIVALIVVPVLYATMLGIREGEVPALEPAVVTPVLDEPQA